MNRPIAVLGIPMDLGAGHRGVDMATRSLRIAGLGDKLRALGFAVRDAGDVAAPMPETVSAGATTLKFYEEILATCQLAAEAAGRIVAAGEFPIFLGGDHSIAIGTIAAAAAPVVRSGGRLGLIWFDAHGDFNTPASSPSGNIHGMPLAVVQGLGDAQLVGLGGFAPKVRPEDTVLIGIRDVDSRERELLRASGMHIFTMRAVDELGIREVVTRAIAMATRDTQALHVSFDMDFVDPQYAPGVGTPCPGGPTYREAHLAMELIADSGRLTSLDLVEVNPIFDERNRTSELAVELILSAVGQRIL
ncbi:MAG: arginase [Candidatus Sericytochromatia bacterium]|nr:arginase [Candidatus Tanganyikabacteria bacterium]